VLQWTKKSGPKTAFDLQSLIQDYLAYGTLNII